MKEKTNRKSPPYGHNKLSSQKVVQGIMEPGIDEKQNADDIFLNVIDTNLSLAKGFFERIEELGSEREQGSDADLDVELSMLRLNFIQCLDDISHHAQALKSRIQSQPTIWESGSDPHEAE